METVGKIAAVAVTALICSAVIRRGAPEFGMVLTLAAGAAVLLLAGGALNGIVEMLEYLAGCAGLEEEILHPVAKTTAIALVTKITGEVCRCGGEGGLAACVETAGVILALWVSLPLAVGVLELMGQLLV